jgi:hypothetical protein
MNSCASVLLSLLVRFKNSLFLSNGSIKIEWRLFHVSLIRNHIHKVYGSCISKIDYNRYDLIFIRSAGTGHGRERFWVPKILPILKKAIINFHDPYPLFWYPRFQND